jgi:hypothetical protein
MSRPSGMVESKQLIKSMNVIQEQDPDVVNQYYVLKRQIEELPKDNHYGLIHNDRYILLNDMYRDNEGLQQHLIDLRKTIESELPFSEMI